MALSSVSTVYMLHSLKLPIIQRTYPVYGVCIYYMVVICNYVSNACVNKLCTNNNNLYTCMCITSAII